MKSTKLFFGVLFALALSCFAVAAFAQNQDVNPYGGIYYNDHSNYRMSGANGLPRTDRANIDTLTNVLKGDLRFDTLNAVVVVYDGAAWVNIPTGGNNLDEAYDKGGAGVGRTITADNGAVRINGNFNVRDDGSQLQVDTNLFDLASILGNQSLYIGGAGMRKYVKYQDSTAHVFMKVSDDSRVGGDTVAALGFIDFNTFEENYVSADKLAAFSFSGDDNYGIGWYQSLYDSAWQVFTGDFSSKQKILEVTHDDSVNIYVESGGLRIVDGTESDGYVLTSDASGNADWQANDPGTGWASYNDDSYTSGSPFVITAGDTTKIPFFWTSAVTPQLPTGVDSLFNRADTTIRGFNGDAYTVRVSFTAQASNASGYGVLLFDIGNGTPVIISEQVFRFPKGSGIDHPFSFTTSLFAGSTFESYGCQIKILAGTGNISMHDFNYVITRTHKAK